VTESDPGTTSVPRNKPTRPRPSLEERWAALQEKFAANAPWLVRQGALVQKTTGSCRFWVVRFYVRDNGRTVQRSVYVGLDHETELRRRVEELLQRYRAPRHWPKEVASFARFAASAHAALGRGLRGSPGRRQRRRG
jgi:hypothetical protein